MLAVNFLVGSSNKTETVIRRQNPVFILTDKNSDIIYSEVSQETNPASTYGDICWEVLYFCGGKQVAKSVISVPALLSTKLWKEGIRLRPVQVTLS